MFRKKIIAQLSGLTIDQRLKRIYTESKTLLRIPAGKRYDELHTLTKGLSDFIIAYEKYLGGKRNEK